LYWEEEYVEHIRKSLAKAAEATDESAPVDDEAVNQQKNDLFVLVGIGHEILLLLKCIVGLVCLVLFRIVYIVSRL
jgi:predicted flap endonuclease-1-like 5' DNA nuclease